MNKNIKTLSAAKNDGRSAVIDNLNYNIDSAIVISMHVNNVYCMQGACDLIVFRIW